MNRTIEDLAASFATSQGVEALVLAGSMTSGLADEGSDYDLHAYTREAVPLEFRARLLKPRAARLELHNTFFEWSDEWIEPDGTVFDLMYRSCDLIEADVEARLGRGEGAVGNPAQPRVELAVAADHPQPEIVDHLVVGLALALGRPGWRGTAGAMSGSNSA